MTERFLLCARHETRGWHALGWGSTCAEVEESAAPWLATGDYVEDSAVIARTDWTPPWDGPAPPEWALWPSVVIMTRGPDPVAVPLLIELRPPALASEAKAR